MGPQALSALLVEFRVAICFFLFFFFWQFVSFCTCRVFALLSAFVLSSGFSFHFTLLGRHSSIYYPFTSSTMYVWPSVFRLRD